MKKAFHGTLAQIGPANGAAPEHAEAPRAKNLRSQARPVAGYTGAYPLARGPRKVRRATRQLTGSTVGALEPSQRPASRYGQNYAQ